MPSVADVPAPSDNYFTGLLSGVKWATNSLTYSFPTSGSDYDYYEGGDAFGELSPAAKSAVRSILASYSSVANVTFTEVSGGQGDLRFADSEGIGTGLSFYPAEGEEGGDVWLEKSGEYGAIYDNPEKGDYGYFTYIHEIGHALGLKHGHVNSVYGAQLSTRDSIEYSVMTYRSYVGASTAGGYTAEFGGFPQTLMQDDIAALQYMYGANYTYNSGDTVYHWSPTTGEMFVNGVGQGAPSDNRIFMTIWDGGGTDTYDFSNYSTNLTINLDPGGWSSTSNDSQYQRPNLAETISGTRLPQGNIANARLYQNNTASLIENAIGGSGNDDIWGNNGNNHLIGGSGDDRIGGFAGIDTILGGEGNDELRIFGLTKDDVVKGGAGSDWLRIWKADANENPVFMVSGTTSLEVRDADGNLMASEFESLEITLGGGINLVDARGVGPNFALTLISSQGDSTYFGGAGSDTLTGGYGIDKLHGGGGIDTIDGAESNDTLSGGAENDWIRGGTGTDTAVYSGGILDYAIRRVAGTNFNIVDARAGSPDGNDSVTDVENFQFSDFTATSFVTDGSGRAVSSTGAGWQAFWDPANAQTWKSYLETYNGAGQRLSQAGTYDDGTGWKSFWDPDNAQIWTSYIETFDTGGQRLTQFGNYDNGSSWKNYWDPSSQFNYVSYSEHYVAGGALSARLGTYDTGESWANYWDPAGQFNYVSYSEHYVVGGAISARVGAYDSGESWANYWDPLGIFNYASYSEHYVVGGAISARVGTYDSGESWANYWDPSGLFNYTSYSEHYVVGGAISARVGTYDSGESWANYWDPNGLFNYSSYSEHYLVGGARSAQVGTYDNGESWKNFWDPANAQAWSAISEHYDTAGDITIRITTWDDGHQTTDWFL